MNQIIERLEGLGYIQPTGTSTKLRDTNTGVRIEFLIAGQFPGDGKPKPVEFPNPVDVGIDIEGVRYLNVPWLLNLKLASGISAAHRAKDIGDAQELIRILKLPRDLVEQLNPYVKQKYLEL